MELHYFLTTNGALGRTSFLDRELRTYNNVILTEYLPRTIVSSLITEWSATAKQNNIETHIIHNCLDESFEGVLFPSLGTGVVNTAIYEKRFDLISLCKDKHVSMAQKQLNKAYENFQIAMKIHDAWEKIYIQNMNFETLNQLTNDVASTILADQKTDYAGECKDRFFGAATTNGPKNYIETLTENMKRYFIKGRPGTGKSTFLKKIALSAQERGFHVERYHCAFDPNSLDMVIIRELNIAIFDSTAPHEYFPSESSDEIIDIYHHAVLPDTDKIYSDELGKISQRYKQSISMATTHLIAANESCKQAEAEAMHLIDRDKLMELKYTITQRIFP